MFVVLWEYEVKPGCEQEFEKVYGPGGDWDSLFCNEAKHAGTYLFRDTVRPRVYLTTDYWHSRSSYEEFLQVRRNDYLLLDAATENLISTERRIGSFDAAAT
jgi:hypothetical protein